MEPQDYEAFLRSAQVTVFGTRVSTLYSGIVIGLGGQDLEFEPQLIFLVYEGVDQVQTRD